MLFLGRWHVSAERSPAAFGWEEIDVALAAERGHGRLVNARYHERDGWSPRLVIRSEYNMNGNLPFGPGIVPGVTGRGWNAQPAQALPGHSDAAAAAAATANGN